MSDSIGENLKLLRKLSRDWRHCFTSTEFSLLMFVYDRTYGWSKVWERISSTQCVDGVFSKEGICYAGACSSSASRARNTLSSLVERGILLRKDSNSPVDRAYYYAINANWEADKEMKLPKRLKENREKESSDCTQKGTMDCTQKGTLDCTQKGTINIVNNKDNRSITVSDSLSESGSEIPTKDNSSTDLKVSADLRNGVKVIEGKKRVRKLKVTNLSVSTELQKLQKRNFPDIPIVGISKGHIIAICKYGKRWTTPEDFFRFISWCYENWATLRHTTLGWMSDAPLAPHARFFATSKLQVILETQYNNKAEVEAWQSLSPEEIRIKKLARLKGVSEDSISQEKTRIATSKLKMNAKSISDAKATTSIKKKRKAIESDSRALELATAKRISAEKDTLADLDKKSLAKFPEWE